MEKMRILYRTCNARKSLLIQPLALRGSRNHPLTILLFPCPPQDPKTHIHTHSFPTQQLYNHQQISQLHELNQLAVFFFLPYFFFH